MTEGTSQGLFVVVAIVIFGIFVALSYTVFGNEGLTYSVNELFTESIEKVEYNINSLGYTAINDDDIVLIQDSDLARAIRDSLGLEEDADITVSDMKDLTVLRANIGSQYTYTDVNITSLNGLEYAENLRELWLHGNSVRSLEPISELYNLRILNVNLNYTIDTLEPLRNLANLDRVMIEGNNYTTIEPLKDLDGIRMLNIGRTSVSDISYLEKMTDLRELYIHGTDITDISVLENMEGLWRLDIRNTDISDLSPAPNVTDLRTE